MAISGTERMFEEWAADWSSHDAEIAVALHQSLHLRGRHDECHQSWQRFSLHGSTIVELEQDKMKRCTDYWDMVTFLKQIGAMPSK